MNYSSLLHSCNANPGDKLRLVCFSYAGGNPNHYLRWQSLLHPGTELVICQLPGRGVYLFDPPYEDMHSLIRDLSKAITELCDKPLIFFGHSMGSKIAYELGLEMQRQGMPLPLHVVISASTPPFHSHKPTAIHTKDDQDFIAAVAKLNGTPPQILRNAELMALCLPALRADYKLVESYVNLSRQRLATKLTLLGARNDLCVSPEELSAWAPLFDTVVEARLFDGGHFFINERSDEVLEYINQSVLKFIIKTQERTQKRTRRNVSRCVLEFNY